MAPRSPTLAFEPTPALEENKENYSPLNDRNGVKALQEYNGSERGSSKEVHFSSLPSATVPVRRAQSIATTTVPLLDPVSSASQMPRPSAKISTTAPEIDINAYFEHSRSLLETIRTNHERDKKTWDEERKLWNTERSMLKSRIADLEFKLNKSTDASRRRYSNDTTTATAQAIRADFSSFSAIGPAATRSMSQPKTTPSPIWEGPLAPATRVFSNEAETAIMSPLAIHLPSISEDEAAIFPALSQQVSPTSVDPLTKIESVPVPIEEIDSRLDGITLKSTALQPSFVARIKTPSQTASPARSPSPRPSKQTPETTLNLEMISLLSPLDEKLKRYAGHTPMNFQGAPGALTGSSLLSTEVPTPTKEESVLSPEKPREPAPTKRPPIRPSEDSDSYFSFTKETKEQLDQANGEFRTEEVIVEMDKQETTAEEDPALKEPLMLDPTNCNSSSHDFLDMVDQKLSEVANRKDSGMSEGTTSPEAAREGQEQGEGESKKVQAEEKDFEMPRLRMKKSTNFGSAYGTNRPGFM